MRSVIDVMPNVIVVTGAAGFAGGHLLDLLLSEPADDTTVVAWHRPQGRPPRAIAGATWEAVDLLDRSAVQRAVDRWRPAVVYHCAGAAHVGRSWSNTAPTFATNLRGTHHLLEALRVSKSVTRVLITGSAMVYRPSEQPLNEDAALVPPSPYGLSKLAQELLGVRVSDTRLSVTVARAFNHAGPRQDPSFAASAFAKQIAEIEASRRPPEIVVGNLEARRDTTDVRDTVRAYRIIAERGEAGRPYNVSSGHAVSIREVLDALIAKARVPLHSRIDPTLFRPNDLPVLLGDSRRLRDELGWTPTIPLSRTLDDLLDYWRSTLT